MLITLAYRVPREHLDAVLGTVTAYPLTEEFASAWDSLPGAGDGRRPRYSALATGLVAATGNPVRLFGENNLAEHERAAGSRLLLLTSDNALDFRLRTAVRAWERHIRGGEGPALLADALPEPEAARPFSDFIEFRGGRVPVAPNWVYRTAAWKVMRRVAAEPLSIGARELRLRIDTDGSLLIWDDLLHHTKKHRTAHGMAKVTVQLTTRAGIEDPILCFDAQLSQIPLRWYGRGTRHTWIARGEGDTPIVRLPVRHLRDVESGEYVTQLDQAIARILEACQLDPLQLPATLPDPPGHARPQLASNRFHVLGNGLGPRFMLYLHKHIQRTLPMLEPLTYAVDKAVRLPKHVSKYPIGGIPADGVGPSGYKRVTIACLYSTADARQRMLNEFKELTGGRHIRPEPGGPAVMLNERLGVVARWCPGLLAHDTVNRSAYLDDLATMAAEPDHLVAVWAETEFHPDAQRPELDAKPHIRRLLGHMGIPAQFMATDPQLLPEGAVPRNPEERKHAARAALRDLLRAAGVLDSRVLDALITPKLPNALERDTLLVGIHARRQQTGTGDPVLVLGMVALHLVPSDLGSCRILVWSDRQKRWVRAAEGTTDFYASAIGSARLGRTEEKAARTRVTIEARLCALATGELAGTPMVIFTDGRATRSIWPGLQNARLGEGVLPGDSLRERGDDVAVVRLNTVITEIGRPVTRVEKSNNPKDKDQPAAPGRKIYRLLDTTLPTWLFPGTSVQTRAKGGDRGARHTRWSLQANKAGRQELGKPWHSYTAKEIVVIEPGSWRPEALATLTARLCEQAISWDDRTTLPVPLHLGTSMDLDHPDYRAYGKDEADGMFEAEIQHTNEEEGEGGP
ncbi:RNaseH domain-containing protein [Spongiactinospora sp. 9N601]|uniref:RNaseH domain-containing protein n=1 Tax=Spongiactinospora sp. 9N601 TaxID=3375149 RepID=UPI0037A94212